MAIGAYKAAVNQKNKGLSVGAGVQSSAGKAVIPGVNASMNATQSGIAKPMTAPAGTNANFQNAMNGGGPAQFTPKTPTNSVDPQVAAAQASAFANLTNPITAADLAKSNQAITDYRAGQGPGTPGNLGFGPQTNGTLAVPPATGQNNVDPAMDTNKLYEDMLGSQDKMWAEQQQTLQGEMAGFQREADSLNARMGGSIAGGYAGLAGSALGSGMKAYNQAANDYQTNRMNTMAKWAESQQDQSRFDQTQTLDQLRLNLDNPDQAEYIDNYLKAGVGGTPEKTAVTLEREANIKKWEEELANNSTHPERKAWLKEHINRAKADIESNAGRHV